nr:hypothetical protein Itr_chr01CG16790 [Ipomoea trifida]
MCLTYQAAGNNCEEVASDNGAQELSNPVEEAGEDGDLAADSQSKGDGRVNVTAGDVGSHGNSHEESKSMANCNGYQPRNGGADAGEDEEQGGDEFSDIGLDRGEAERIIEPSKSYGRHIDLIKKCYTKE